MCFIKRIKDELEYSSRSSLDFMFANYVSIKVMEDIQGLGKTVNRAIKCKVHNYKCNFDEDFLGDFVYVYSENENEIYKARPKNNQLFIPYSKDEEVGIFYKKLIMKIEFIKIVEDFVNIEINEYKAEYIFCIDESKPYMQNIFKTNQNLKKTTKNIFKYLNEDWVNPYIINIKLGGNELSGKWLEITFDGGNTIKNKELVMYNMSGLVIESV